MEFNYVEEAILDAAKTLQAVRGDHSSGRMCWWPDMAPDEDDFPAACTPQYWGDVDMMDRVLYLWLGPRSCLTKREKDVIWLRCGRGYIQTYDRCGQKWGISRQRVHVLYQAALLKLTNWLKLLGYKLV